MAEDKVCFVICPIGKAGSDTRKRSDLTFNYIIKPVVENFGYLPIRADKINESGIITHQIIDYIINSSLVIADLTDNNPNVFYELAIRHIVEKPYIQMTKSDQKIPFDVSGMRTILFDIDLEQADIAKQELAKQIDSIETNEFKQVNPYTLSRNYLTVQNIIKERGNIEPGDITDIVLKSVNELRSMMDDMRKDINNLTDSPNYSKYYEDLNDLSERKRNRVLTLLVELESKKASLKEAIDDDNHETARLLLCDIEELQTGIMNLKRANI